MKDGRVSVHLESPLPSRQFLWKGEHQKLVVDGRVFDKA